MALPLEHLMLNFATALLLAVAVPHVSRASCIIQATNPSTLQPFNPSTLSYTYDRLGHMLSATVSGVSTNYYAYSIHGQLTDEVQNGVSIARTYDSLNRPTGYRLMQNAECRMMAAVILQIVLILSK